MLHLVFVFFCRSYKMTERKGVLLSQSCIYYKRIITGNSTFIKFRPGIGNISLTKNCLLPWVITGSFFLLNYDDSYYQLLLLIMSGYYSCPVNVVPCICRRMPPPPPIVLQNIHKLHNVFTEVYNGGRHWK